MESGPARDGRDVTEGLGKEKGLEMEEGEGGKGEREERKASARLCIRTYVHTNKGRMGRARVRYPAR